MPQLYLTACSPLKTCLRQSARGESGTVAGGSGKGEGSEEARRVERREEMSLVRSNEERRQGKKRERERPGQVRRRARNPCNVGTYAIPDCIQDAPGNASRGIVVTVEGGAGGEEGRGEDLVVEMSVTRFLSTFNVLSRCSSVSWNT